MLEIKFNDKAQQRLTLHGTKFTPKQFAVLTRRVEGKSIDKIAEELEISAATVKYHLGNILEPGSRSNSFSVAAEAGKDYYNDITVLRDGEEITSLEELIGKPFGRKRAPVFQEMNTGSSNDKIARAVGITEETVKYHISGICEKIGGNRLKVITAANALNEAAQAVPASIIVLPYRRVPETTTQLPSYEHLDRKFG